ncbi:protocatechuate 3,4-dioxygenase subunit beta [Jannaschia sp. CCS1]|uniref:protocatechuate 3,4-dioxygenase subunit beta n=1 Tax=Jannaschia sp. (strain CCS1) TaxID=290400 RepID=UPI000053C3B9|nr:protocatechuate 3,4-dioxygenase subunit beta [Jannaschia sp. CCS1]ABD57080.1 protocatechuate 3,4-dioxygenase, beta subunit [Jannaschia sp. CCS1]
MSIHAPRDLSRHPAALTPRYRSSVLRSPKQRLIALPDGPADRTGPTFGHDMIGALDHDLILNHAHDGAPVGERIIVHGRVRDEDERPVRNTLVEVWQANASGRYRHKKDTFMGAIDPNFGGCGRTVTDDQGYYRFNTIKPGAYPWPNGGNNWRPAHIHFSVFGAAFCQRLITQLYFEGDPLIPLCDIVQTVPDPRDIDMLMAKLDMETTLPFDSIAYRFDIVLRGARSTPFENRMEGN